MLVGCSGHQVPEQDLVTTKLVWPAAPLDAKIAWVGEYQVLEDTASRTGFWGKLGDFFLGPKIAHMTRPYGVCTDNGSRLFVADTAGAKIHVFDMVNESYFAIEGDENAGLQAPIGLNFFDNGLYITDSAQGRILRYDFQRRHLDLWGPRDLQRPTGITVDQGSGWFYVTDTAAHEIVVLDRSGVEKFRFGGRGTGNGEFNFPTDIWADGTDRIYVTDALNARIQIFTGAGEFVSAFGQAGDTPGSFAKPKGLAVDSHGHIFVCDALFDAVQVFDRDGRLLISFGDNGTRPGQFWMPSGLFIDRQNRIFVADTYNRRIQVFQSVH